LIRLEGERVVVEQKVKQLQSKLQASTIISEKLKDVQSKSFYMTNEQIEAEKERLKEKLRKPIGIQQQVKITN
jgi:ABC-type phosphate transport system auxiliary subunit